MLGAVRLALLVDRTASETGPAPNTAVAIFVHSGSEDGCKNATMARIGVRRRTGVLSWMADGPRSAIACSRPPKNARDSPATAKPSAERRGARLPSRPSPPTPAAAGSSSASAGRGTAPKTHRAGRDDYEREPQTLTLGGAARLAPGRPPTPAAARLPRNAGRGTRPAHTRRRPERERER